MTGQEVGGLLVLDSHLEGVTRGEGSLGQDLQLERTDDVDVQGSGMATATLGKEDVSRMRLGAGH